MITLYSNLPSLDLHGFDRDYARIKINEFVYDKYRMKKKKIVIIHGNGAGILKKTCQQTLKNNRYVEKYKINNFNSGETLVDLK